MVSTCFPHGFPHDKSRTSFVAPKLRRADEAAHVGLLARSQAQFEGDFHQSSPGKLGNLLMIVRKSLKWIIHHSYYFLLEV
jgi:hypothetical protein